MNSTVYYKPIRSKTASLFILDGSNEPKVIPLRGDMTLGREYPLSDRDIRVVSQIVGRKHGEFIYDDSDGSFYYIDNNSMNGTYVNGEKLMRYNERGSKACKLSDGDILRIDCNNLNEPHPEAVLMYFSTALDTDEAWRFFSLGQADEVVIGRDMSCDLKLNDTMASRFHAVLTRKGNNWYIQDNDSTNGVGLNGIQLENVGILYRNNIIRIANTILVFTGNGLLYNLTVGSKVSLEVNIKDKTVGGKKVLLKDINATFGSGDFVLILGGSGAGKTTLIKAILGESKANGKIILNGQDLYKNFKSLKSQIGMVPQFLTLRENDTVRKTLIDTAAIKLGHMYSKEERLARVEQVLDHVGITEHADKYIIQLSGGQQKKVSVANQLLGFQKVFICDEPDSGLDAASRTQQMEILKEIANEGKIVMVISHEPDDAVEEVNGSKVTLFTKVVVLARSSTDKAGHLAFFGDVGSAMDFFGVTKLQDIMLEINPPSEGGKGKADEYILKYLTLRGAN